MLPEPTTFSRRNRRQPNHPYGLQPRPRHQLRNDNASSSSSSTSPSRSDSPPRLQQAAFFAPPFYNRPPTPLPPSPSLTSLLRPSRPTTPDSSADEFEPVPRASPKVPTYEYYGFVLYLFSSLTFLIYILWSYLPSPFLHALGIYYYPNRWWSLALPSYLVMTLVYIYVALASYNTGHLTLSLEHIETIVDEAANIAALDSNGRIKGSYGGWYGNGNGARRGSYNNAERRGSYNYNTGPGGGGNSRRGSWKGMEERRDWREIWSIGTDAVMDVPLGGVCEVLYGEGRETDGSDDE
ncbi:PIG-P-domain-containing protein [Xylogone sp. PMI_703]|nr:PIG-P-domain-containing protein [Xylogone sp. PMI_703]